MHSCTLSNTYIFYTANQVMLRYGARDDASLLLQYGFVMGGARGEANPHGPLPAALRAALRAAEPATEPELADSVAAEVAADGGSQAPACKRQRVVG